MAKIAGRKRHGTYIILGEQVEGAEELVVFEVEGAGGLEVTAEGDEGRRLNNELLWGPYLAVLLVVLRSRDPRRPPRPAAVVGVVVVLVHVGGVMLCWVAGEHGGDAGAVAGAAGWC